jgi:hypothetical protein
MKYHAPTVKWGGNGVQPPADRRAEVERHLREAIRRAVDSQREPTRAGEQWSTAHADPGAERFGADLERKLIGRYSVPSYAEAGAPVSVAVSPGPGAANVGAVGQMDDDFLVGLLSSQPLMDGSQPIGIIPSFWQQLGGLVALERTHPKAYGMMRGRASLRFGAHVFDALYRNDARILEAINKSIELRPRILDQAQELGAEGSMEARDYLYDVAAEYELNYMLVAADYKKNGELALFFTRYNGSVEDILHALRVTALDIQQEANAREREIAARASVGQRLVGKTVAELEGFFRHVISLEALMEPEEGTTTRDEAITWGTISGAASAVIKVDGRFYLYKLSRQYARSDAMWLFPESEKRSEIVPAGGTDVAALITTDGYVLRLEDGVRFWGGEQSGRPGQYLAAEDQLLEQHGERLSNEQLLRIFERMVVQLVLLQLADSQERIENELRRLRPGRTPSAWAGQKLRTNAAAIRNLARASASVAAALEDREPTASERATLEQLTMDLGRLVSEDPTAALLVLERKGFEDPVAEMKSEPAAAFGITELERRLENIAKIRAHLHNDPESALDLTPIHPAALAHFTPDQRSYLERQVSFHELASFAKTIGLTVADLVLLIFGLATGGLTAVLATGISGGLGGWQTKEAFEQAELLGAMSAYDLPGGTGYQLATSEDAASAKKWAWIGLGLMVLDIGVQVGGLALSARRVSRLRAVLQAGDIPKVLAEGGITFGETARRLGVSERALLRALETARGTERRQLLARIRSAMPEAPKPPPVAVVQAPGITYGPGGPALGGPRLRGRLGEVTRFLEVDRYPGRMIELFNEAQRTSIYTRIENGQLSLRDFAKMIGHDGAEQVYFRVGGRRFIDHVFPAGEWVVLRESKNVSDLAVAAKIEDQLAKDMELLNHHPEALVHWRISGNGRIDEAAFDILEAMEQKTGGRFRFQLQEMAVPPFEPFATPPLTLH